MGCGESGSRRIVPCPPFPWFARRLEGGSLSGPAEMLAVILALRAWGPSASSQEGHDVFLGFPVATDNTASTYICGQMYSSQPPLSWCLRELALTAVAVQALPAALHVSGAANVVPDRLSRGCCSPPCLAALGLDPARRRTEPWTKQDWWHVRHVFNELA